MIPEQAVSLGRFCRFQGSLHFWFPPGYVHVPKWWHEWKDYLPKAILRGGHVFNREKKKGYYKNSISYSSKSRQSSLTFLPPRGLELWTWKKENWFDHSFPRTLVLPSPSLWTERFLLHIWECTFRASRQCCSFNGVCLQASFKHIIPELHDAILSTCYKTLWRHIQEELHTHWNEQLPTQPQQESPVGKAASCVFSS